MLFYFKKMKTNSKNEKYSILDNNKKTKTKSFLKKRYVKKLKVKNQN